MFKKVVLRAVEKKIIKQTKVKIQIFQIMNLSLFLRSLIHDSLVIMFLFKFSRELDSLELSGLRAPGRKEVKGRQLSAHPKVSSCNFNHYSKVKYFNKPLLCLLLLFVYFKYGERQ